MSKADRVTLKDATAACKGRAALPRMSTCRRAGSRLGRWGSDTAHPPRPHRRREALRRHRAEVLVLKQTAGQAMRTLRDHHRARIGEAARFGVSPTTACSCAAPAPMRSPTTTGPVAMPMRTRSRSGAGELLDRIDERRRQCRTLARGQIAKLAKGDARDG